LGAKVYLCIWWGSVESNDVSEVALNTPDSELHETFSWGQSAGAMSVSLQMVANGGNPEGLFRAAFMQSGSPIPAGDITLVGIYNANLFYF
jgi:hypothetical protein